MKSRQNIQRTKIILTLLLGAVLLFSITSLNSSFAANANFSFPSDPSDGNLSNTPATGSNDPFVISSGTNVFVAWQDHLNIFFTDSSDNGDNFSASTSIGTTSSAEPKLAVEGDNVFAIWIDSGDVEFNRSTNGGQTFGIAEVLLSSATASSADPQIVVADSDSSSPDDVYAVWRNNDAADDIYFTKSSDNGANFGSISDIGDTNVGFADPQINSVGDNVNVIWQTLNDIMFAHSENNGGLFTTFDIGNSTGVPGVESYPQIASSGSFVYAVWQQGSDIKFTNSSDSGASFSAPVDIGDTGGSLRDSTPKLAVSGNDVYVVWRDGASNAGDIKFVKSSDNGENFGTEINLSNNSEESSSPVISVSGENISVAWEDSTPSSGSNKDILFSLSDDSGDSFGDSTIVIENGGNSLVPSLASSDNTAFVVWQDSTPGPNEVFIKLGTTSSISASFDENQYKLSDTATITITDPSSADDGIINAIVTSDADPSGIIVSLSEGPIETFTGTISFTENDLSSGTILEASPGNTITVSFGGVNGTASIFQRSIDIGSTFVNLGSITHPEVNDQNANFNPEEQDLVEVEVTSEADPIGITLTLTETGNNTGIFGGLSGDTQSNLRYLAGDVTPNIFDTLTFSSNVTFANDNPELINNVTVTVKSTSDEDGITLTLLETGIDTSCFEGTFGFSTTSSDSATGKILAVPGDFFSVVDSTDTFTTYGMVEPNPNFADGAIITAEVSDPETNEECPTVDEGSFVGGLITATHQSANDSATLIPEGLGGGGGGGLVRPSLVVNALAGISGGGSAYSSPTLQLSNLVKLGQLDVPSEVEQMIYDHDSTIPTPAMELGFFENFDYPLTINDKGFVLSGYSTTLETQTLETNTPHTIKFMYYEADKIQHFSLYTNLRDVNTAIHQSDTQLIYNDGQELLVVDPNGFFQDVSFTLNEIDDLKKEIVLEITFANTMDTTDIILRSWDPYLNSFDTYILDAITVVSDEIIESPITTYEEPVIENLQSQSIPIWIKNNAAWWSDQQIGDSDFIAGIEYLITNGIIIVPGVEVGESTTTEIPDWIKNNASWWSDSLITDGDFTEAMQWLVANGVIQI